MIRVFALVLAASALWFGSLAAASALTTVRPLSGFARQAPPNFTPVGQDRAMNCVEACRRKGGSWDQCKSHCGE